MNRDVVVKFSAIVFIFAKIVNQWTHLNSCSIFNRIFFPKTVVPTNVNAMTKF